MNNSSLWQDYLFLALLLWMSILFLFFSFKFEKKFNFFNPLSLFLSSWIFVFIFSLCNFIIYDRILSKTSFFVIVLYLCVFFVGSWLGGLANTNRNSFGIATSSKYRFWLATYNQDNSCYYKKNLVHISNRLAFCLLIFVIIHVVITLVSIWNVPLDITVQRFKFWDGFFEQEIGLLGTIKSVVTSNSVLMIIAIPIFWNSKKYLFFAVGIISFFVVSIDGLYVGGRSNIVFVSLILSISYSTVKYLNTGYYIKFKQILWFLLIGMGLFYFAFIWFPITRNPHLVEGLDSYLAWLHDAKIANWIYDFEMLSNLPLLAYSTSYLSMPLAKLTFFLEESNISEWYLLGAYNLPTVSKLLSIIGIPDYWLQTRTEISKISLLHGYASNPWSTFIRDFIIDFGIFGGALVVAVGAFLIQKTYIRMLNGGSFFLLVTISLTSVGIAVSPFISFFQIRLISNTLILVFLMWLISSITKLVLDRN